MRVRLGFGLRNFLSFSFLESFGVGLSEYLQVFSRYMQTVSMVTLAPFAFFLRTATFFTRGMFFETERADFVFKQEVVVFNLGVLSIATEKGPAIPKGVSLLFAKVTKRYLWLD